MKSNNFVKLQRFLKEDLEVPIDEDITVDTEIEYDLGITGTDAVEFILLFGEKFNIDVSHFQAADYFEGEGVLAPIIYKLIYSFIRKKRTKFLTIGHLLYAMETGVLNP